MDQKIFEKYISDNGRDVYSFCKYLTKNNEDADDLYQQTFMVAFQKGEIDDSRNPKSYLIAIAANIWNNSIRKTMWRSKKANMVLMPDEDMADLSDTKQNVEDKILQDDEASRVRKAVDGLPDKFKIVIVMYYTEEMSIGDIAEALNIPLGTVKSRMNKAKKLLKERLTYEG